ncbi:MAG: nuclear transport factor 2 family protein, partial [Sphingomicrobium sp.]
MSSNDERVRLVEQGWRAFQEGDLESMLELFDSEIEVYAPPEAGNPGTFHGHDGYLRWAGYWFDAWDEFTQEITDIEPIGERCVITNVRQYARGRSAGVELERAASWLYELRDGKVVYMAL